MRKAHFLLLPCAGKRSCQNPCANDISKSAECNVIVKCVIDPEEITAHAAIVISGRARPHADINRKSSQGGTHKHSEARRKLDKNPFEMLEGFAMNRPNANDELDRFLRSLSYSELCQELAAVPSEMTSGAANERILAQNHEGRTANSNMKQGEATSSEIKEGLRTSTATNDKRKRTLFTPFQLSRMEEEFGHNMYVVGLKRWRLATELGLTEKQVKIWFQNRRMKLKREQVKTKCINSGFPWY